MKFSATISIVAATILFVCTLGAAAIQAQTIQSADPSMKSGDGGLSGAIEQKPLLTSAQRSAIYQEVIKDKSKVAAKDFSPVVGTDVPPMIELYMLPDSTLAEIPEAKVYKYTMVDNKVVLVDPTRMRVIDVIGPVSQ